MELSVIIVNYNVKHFLEQCLMSVHSALKDIDAEVFVVDNASSDDSCSMVKQKFPTVKLIENYQNVGFSKANNQAIAQSQGKYILLLNPDTVVQEDTFTKCIAFMNSHSDAGAITVKMIDGKGNYLPESKRGFPSPWVSFFKIFGLTSLFPKSKIFARYYLGHLDKNATNQIDVLPGAFMFIKKEALNKSGLLDEQFFMYGEDIDLSYRITQAGYKNYYYPECQIIHYKGESTKKGSLNYVLIFYKAMIIFAKKHFKSNKASTFIILINFAIYFRAFLSIIKRIINTLWLPTLDALLIALGLLTITPIWENFRFQSSNVYPTEYVAILGSFYIIAWLLTLWINGAYDKPQKLTDSIKGILTGSILILVVYSILPNEIRFSRAIILLTGFWALISTLSVRFLLSKLNPRAIINNKFIKKIAIVGSNSEEQRVKDILNNSGVKYIYVGNFELKEAENQNSISFERLEEFVRINSVDELIFCTQSISMQNIVTAMLFLSSLGKEYKIAPHEGSFIIGSNSIESTGELYTLDIKAIGTQASKRNKRLFDLSISSLLILLIPILLFIMM
ncbi:MAG TPA: glycosyltransferase [Tenuifilaceae bacterium]|nr:glycosyltransferase [Tenuifilaceae bacterium]